MQLQIPLLRTIWPPPITYSFIGIRKTSTRKISPIKLPPGKSPPGKFPPNIPTRVFKFFVLSLLSPSSLILLKRLFCNSVLKVLKSEIQKLMYQKNCSLPAQVWAFHEECDVTKFNQLNRAAWILPGELSSLTIYKYRLTFINT